MTTLKGDELQNRFITDRDHGKRILTDNNEFKRKNQVRKCSKHAFGFSEHQENATYRVGYQVMIKKDDAVVSNGAAPAVDGKKRMKCIWNVPEYTSIATQHLILTEY